MRPPIALPRKAEPNDISAPKDYQALTKSKSVECCQPIRVTLVKKNANMYEQGRSVLKDFPEMESTFAINNIRMCSLMMFILQNAEINNRPVKFKRGVMIIHGFPLNTRRVFKMLTNNTKIFKRSVRFRKPQLYRKASAYFSWRGQKRGSAFTLELNGTPCYKQFSSIEFGELPDLADEYRRVPIYFSFTRRRLASVSLFINKAWHEFASTLLFQKPKRQWAYNFDARPNVRKLRKLIKYCGLSVQLVRQNGISYIMKAAGKCEKANKILTTWETFYGQDKYKRIWNEIIFRYGELLVRPPICIDKLTPVCKRKKLFIRKTIHVTEKAS